MSSKSKAAASSGTLSEKFSKIAARNIGESGRQTRKIVVVRQQTNKRSVQANAKRGLNQNNRPQNKGPEKKPVKQIGRGGRGPSRGRGRGRGRGKPQSDRKDAAPSQSVLDMELDSYWYAAGKGPNPVVAALDKDMDNYFKNRAAKTDSNVDDASTSVIANNP